ncbi:TAXI family TRAP transporter solute-binding subunit (plasmid) [Sulfitobacter sp. W027]|uniref:TAXI family TRAP transporter solute-binding subunit n=1 Tax=Sulfitobacter sp. W027 TaxID=2867025 RepID=UPI0021A3122F|nr:TAXI family TRAP transporter solute-binding subunit [Sulfitobacter sp. W027]UWR35194.1 TAXI family TRAP transporter solute-binding subunit [Sulfitobacter sp. W027]
MKLFQKGALAAYLALALTGGALAQSGPVAVGTLPQGSLGYSIGAGVALVVSENTDVNMRAVGQGGSSVFIPALNRREIAFSTSNTFEAVFATEGRGNFDGNANPEVRVAAMLQPFEVGIMVAADSEIQSLEDLRGKPFPVGYARQQLVGVMQDAVLEAAGMSSADLDGVPVPNFVEGANLLAQGTVAGVMLAPGSGVVRQTMAQLPVRFITVIDGEDAAKSVAKSLPGSYVGRVEPSDRLPEITEPVDLIGYQYALLTHAGAEDDLVYKVVKALYENKDALAETHGSFRRFNPQDMALTVEGAIYHPGAERFYREVGLLE